LINGVSGKPSQLNFHSITPFSTGVIADVREEENYLACSLDTRSEIVVLIKKDDTILGQIDIDGHAVDRFRREEEEFLSEMAEILASKWR
jgi:GAF domain-containing protein